MYLGSVGSQHCQLVVVCVVVVDGLNLGVTWLQDVHGSVFRVLSKKVWGEGKNGVEASVRVWVRVRTLA